jgi:hypothetical protein
VERLTMPSIVRFKYGWLNLDSVTEIEDNGEFMRIHFRDDSEPRKLIDADEMNRCRRCLEGFRIDNHVAPARTRPDITPIHRGRPVVAEAACCEPGPCRPPADLAELRARVEAVLAREDAFDEEGGAA